jgi:hypothetical protein
MSGIAERNAVIESMVPVEWQRVPVEVSQSEVYRLVRAGLVEYEFRAEPFAGRASHSFMWWKRKAA